LNKINPYKKSISNRLKVLKLLHRFGWLRTRDIAALVWLPTHRGRSTIPPTLSPPKATSSGLRMAQRTLRALQTNGFVLQTKAPDGAWIFALSQKGANTLNQIGINARSGKDLLRDRSFSYYRHRCISTEIAISALLEGCKVTTELELLKNGSMFVNPAVRKLPDVLVRQYDNWYWVEVEKSRKNQSDYLHLLKWLQMIRVDQNHTITGFPNARVTVVFVCIKSFKNRLIKDLINLGWSEVETDTVIDFKDSLYQFDFNHIL
jgi:hypothetical protein